MASYRVQVLQGTTSEWNTADPVLGVKESGYETCADGTTRMKIGDGVRKWSALPYAMEYQEIDNTVQEGSTNPVSGGAVHAALQGVQASGVVVDAAVQEGSKNPVSGGAVYTALQGVQTSGVVVDATVQAGSKNPVAGGAVHTALAGKAGTVHTHAQSDVTGLASALAGKAAAEHTHAQSDVTGLAAALAGKAGTVHAHSQSDVTGLASALGGKADAVHTHPDLEAELEKKTSVVAPPAYAYSNGHAFKVQKFPKLLTGGAVAAGSSFYWPWVLRVDDKIAEPLGKYYMWIAADHAYAAGKGVLLYYSNDLTSGWTLYGAVYRMTRDGANKETETPSVMWNAETGMFIMTIHGYATYDGEGQTTWRVTGTDGIHWSGEAKLFDLDGERLHGNLHNGYFIPFELGSTYFGYSLMGGENGGACLHYSEDGLTWRTDHRKLGRWLRRTGGVMNPQHGTVIVFAGMVWFIGVYGTLVSGTTAKVTNISMCPMADLRTPVGHPTRVITPDGEGESDDVRCCNVFSEGGKLYLYYTCGTETATYVNCAVMEEESYAVAANPGTGGDTTPKVLTITKQPANVACFVGAVTQSLQVTALTSDGSVIAYQWYESSDGMAAGGTSISGATESSFALPATLTEGTHYYYCVATSATAGSKTSNVATVTCTVHVAQTLALYTFTGKTGTAPATIADESGNGYDLQVNGTMNYASGGLQVDTAGQSLYLPTIPLPSQYTIRLQFTRTAMGNHRVLVIPTHDLNGFTTGPTDAEFTFVIESTDADRGFTPSFTSSGHTNQIGLTAATGLVKNSWPWNVDMTIAVDGDTLTSSGTVQTDATYTMETNTVTIVGFTAALSQGVYLCNRATGDRPLNGFIKKIEIEV